MSFDPRTYYQDPRAAAGYDQERFRSLSGRVFQWAERRVLKKILRLLPPGAAVLDAPCGTGRLLEIFLSAGFRALGADISAQMLAVARKRTARWNGHVCFSRVDFVSMPLSDRSVTAVFSVRFLPHIAPQERVLMLSEFRRVSRRFIIISVSISTPWHRLRRRIKGWLGHPKPVRYPVAQPELIQELRQAGLRPLKSLWTFPILSEQVFVICEPI